MSRLPADDAARVDAFLDRVIAIHDWESVGMSLEVDVIAGKVMPFLPGDRGQLLVNLKVSALYSDAALRGILAHEFAHAARASRLGRDWFDRMSARYGAEERLADRIATGWGFGREIRRGRDVETPRIHLRIALLEPRIVRRWERRELAAQARFNQLRQQHPAES
jgi:hypothetical protein